MSSRVDKVNKLDCKWCGFSYKGIKQGREYLYHDEATCELNWLRKRIDQLEAFIDARMEAQECEAEIDRIMAMSDAEIRAELRQFGEDPDEVARRVGEVIRKAIASAEDSDGDSP